MGAKRENRICQNCKKDFTIESDDFGFYEKIKVPPPTFCPECRLQRRMVFRNERTLYKHECGLCKSPIISMYNPKNNFKVYCHKCWWGDLWNPMEYGSIYDLRKTFFIQFQELHKKVPRPALIVSESTKCDYCNYFAEGKDCYLCFGSIKVENCLYGSPYESKYCVDTYLARECEYCYECIDCEKLSNSLYAQDCSNSFNLIYCYDCKNCQDCIGCAGLRGQKYYIFNKPYPKEEYLRLREELLSHGSDGLEKIKENFNKIKLAVPHIYNTFIQSASFSGNHVVQSKNAHNSFDIKHCKDVNNCVRIIDGKDVHDANYCEFMESCYEYIGFWKTSQTKFSNTCGESSDLIYSDFCSNSSHLFACIGLRNKSYCILNKQYTKEEYESLVPKILKHMNDMPYVDPSGRIYKYGEFFPADLSPFCYNETIAQEYFPLDKEEAVKKGYKWKDGEERNYRIDIQNTDIPKSIKEVNESIINQVIECEHEAENKHPANCGASCTQAFKVIEDELKFYQRMNLPIPRLCPNCRHYERLKQRNPLKLWHRQCMKEGCPNEFKTSYAPDRPEIVYCEKCYQQEIY